jgi:hypothetical protein
MNRTRFALTRLLAIGALCFGTAAPLFASTTPAASKAAVISPFAVRLTGALAVPAAQTASVVTTSPAAPVDQEEGPWVACAACVLAAVGLSICCAWELAFECATNPTWCNAILAACSGVCIWALS